MSFRRIPFQFSATDPVERQRELEKRFGVSSQDKMYVDSANPLLMGPNVNTTTSSPRLQHRVPIFVEGYDKPVKSSVDSNSATLEHKPKVRVIPIEIEGEEMPPSSRQRTYSGPAGVGNKQNDSILQEKDAFPLKGSIQDLSKPPKAKPTSEPKVYNIPIKVEGPGATVKNTCPKSAKAKSPVKKHPLKINGCTATKHAKTSPKEEPEEELSEEQKLENNIKISLKKIDDVLEEFKSYESGVKDFSGTNKDKQYRYLDEMLTRCMLKLDDVETMGNEQVRSARKNAVKLVQASVDLLERKVNGVNDQNESVESHKQDHGTDVGLVEKLEVEKAATDCDEHEGTITNQPVLPNEKNELSSEVLKNENKTEVNNVEEVEMKEIVQGSLENQQEVEMSESINTVLQSGSDEEMKEIQTASDSGDSNNDCEQLQKNLDIEMEEAASDTVEIKSGERVPQSDRSGASQSN